MKTSTRNFLIVGVIVILAVGGYWFLTRPDQRTASQRIGDAINALPQGVDKASEQLQPRTPGQKLGDMIKDNTQPH